jgi:hypothetical protein
MPQHRLSGDQPELLGQISTSAAAITSGDDQRNDMFGLNHDACPYAVFGVACNVGVNLPDNSRLPSTAQIAVGAWYSAYPKVKSGVNLHGIATLFLIRVWSLIILTLPRVYYEAIGCLNIRHIINHDTQPYQYRPDYH